MDLIRPLIAAGYHVIMCDADVVIMSDPWPWVLPGLARDAAMRHRVAQMVKADVLVTTDCIDEQVPLSPSLSIQPAIYVRGLTTAVSQ